MQLDIQYDSFIRTTDPHHEVLLVLPPVPCAPHFTHIFSDILMYGYFSMHLVAFHGCSGVCPLWRKEACLRSPVVAVYMSIHTFSIRASAHASAEQIGRPFSAIVQASAEFCEISVNTFWSLQSVSRNCNSGLEWQGGS